jgi:hypothetical protein
MNIVEFDECFITSKNENIENLMRMEINATTGESFDHVGWDYDEVGNMETLSGVQVDYYYNDAVTTKDRTIPPIQEYVISLKNGASEDMYSVAFHYCNLSPMQAGSVDMTVLVSESNPGPEFLGAGLAPIPNVYFFMSMLFGVTVSNNLPSAPTPFRLLAANSHHFGVTCWQERAGLLMALVLCVISCVKICDVPDKSLFSSVPPSFLFSNSSHLADNNRPSFGVGRCSHTVILPSCLRCII